MMLTVNGTTDQCGYLDQAVPVPPPGVFDYLRSHGSNKFTWQPRRDVRIACGCGTAGHWLTS
ncbi:MAG: hypothetical protein ACJ73N_08945 [Bryobacteraceae bacterium]